MVIGSRYRTHYGCWEEEYSAWTIGSRRLTGVEGCWSDRNAFPLHGRRESPPLQAAWISTRCTIPLPRNHPPYFTDVLQRHLRMGRPLVKFFNRAASTTPTNEGGAEISSLQLTGLEIRASGRTWGISARGIKNSSDAEGLADTINLGEQTQPKKDSIAGSLEDVKPRWSSSGVYPWRRTSTR